MILFGLGFSLWSRHYSAVLHDPKSSSSLLRQWRFSWPYLALQKFYINTSRKGKCQLGKFPCKIFICAAVLFKLLVEQLGGAQSAEQLGCILGTWALIFNVLEGTIHLPLPVRGCWVSPGYVLGFGGLSDTAQYSPLFTSRKRLALFKACDAYRKNVPFSLPRQRKMKLTVKLRSERSSAGSPERYCWPPCCEGHLAELAGTAVAASTPGVPHPCCG